MFTVALQYSLKLRILIPSALFSFIRSALAIQGLLYLHKILRVCCFCPSSVKNVIGNFIEIALKLWIALGSIVILTILILLIQEHGISFHLYHL